MSATLDVRTLGEAIARALGLRSGETVEIQRDRLNPNRVLVLRVANEE